MTDEQIELLKQAASAATPQNIDSAKIIEHAIGANEYIECPHCGGDGSVLLEADYCNYDGEALGVQFYGIGDAHVLAEAYFRQVNPKAILSLIERLERAENELAILQAATRDNEDVSLHDQLCTEFGMDTESTDDELMNAVVARRIKSKRVARVESDDYFVRLIERYGMAMYESRNDEAVRLKIEICSRYGDSKRAATRSLPNADAVDAQRLQRWKPKGAGGHTTMLSDNKGKYVKYADVLAMIAASAPKEPK